MKRALGYVAIGGAGCHGFRAGHRASKFVTWQPGSLMSRNQNMPV
jgi:hypothetical protein